MENAEPVTDPKFDSKRSDIPLQFLMQNHPRVEKPFVELDVGAALCQVDFSTLSNKNNFSLSRSYNPKVRILIFFEIEEDHNNNNKTLQNPQVLGIADNKHKTYFVSKLFPTGSYLFVCCYSHINT
jgi:hypothetical protein